MKFAILYDLRNENLREQILNLILENCKQNFKFDEIIAKPYHKEKLVEVIENL